MKKISIKVCGLKDDANVSAVARLEPEFMGFILYKDSPRYISLIEAAKMVRIIPGSVRTVAVLVNEPIANAIEIAESGVFDMIQLHGNESVHYCKELHNHITIIKAFSINDILPENLSQYEPFCRMFLFDTAGKEHGGTGRKFSHNVLSHYNLKKDFILSGGISPDDSEYIRSLQIPSMSGIDLNSRFETKPGLKDTALLKTFIEKIRKHEFND